MKTMTLRNVPEDLARELEQEKQRRGKSLNQLAIDLMEGSLVLCGEKPRSNGLAELAGNWSEQDLQEFQRATAQCEQIDEELWS